MTTEMQRLWDGMLDGPIDSEAVARRSRLDDIAVNGILVEVEARNHDGIRTSDVAWITTAHPASSYGIPVLVMGIEADGQVYSPADLTARGMAVSHVYEQLSGDDDTWATWESRRAAARNAGYITDR